MKLTENCEYVSNYVKSRCMKRKITGILYNHRERIYSRTAIWVAQIADNLIYQYTTGNSILSLSIFYLQFNIAIGS